MAEERTNPTDSPGKRNTLRQIKRGEVFYIVKLRCLLRRWKVDQVSRCK